MELSTSRERDRNVTDVYISFSVILSQKSILPFQNEIYNLHFSYTSMKHSGGLYQIAYLSYDWEASEQKHVPIIRLFWEVLIILAEQAEKPS